jgi:hypothetical protein
VYEFSHFSFAEYLAAVQARAPAAKLEDRLLEQVADPWWRQTLLFYAALVPDASVLIERCLAGDNPTGAQLTLALECLKEAREVDTSMRARVESMPDRWIDDPDPVRRAAAAEALLSQRLARMERRGAIHVDRSPIAAFEYQLFLDDEAAGGIFRQPDHLPFGYRFGGGAPVSGIRAVDASAFCDWLTRREASGWRFRLPQQGETDGIGHWFIGENGWDCVSRSGKGPLISPEKLCIRYYDDLTRAGQSAPDQSVAYYFHLPPTMDVKREEALNAQLTSLGLDVGTVSDFATLVAVHSRDSNTLASAVESALEYNLDIEKAWDPDLYKPGLGVVAAEFIGARGADLCPDLQLSSVTLRFLDLGQVIENLRIVTNDFSSPAEKPSGSELQRYAGWLARQVDDSLSIGCAVLDARRPITPDGVAADRVELNMMLRCHVRPCIAIAAGLILFSKPEVRDSGRLSAYRELYVALAMLEERVQGVMSPYETIMIVKERG